MLSPHLRLLAAVPLDAPLAAAALAPSAAGQPPRFAVAADTAGMLHVLDHTGRSLMPPAPIIYENSAGRVLSLVFVSAPAQRSGTQPAPMLFAAAISYGDDSLDREGFTFCLYRLNAARQPTPTHRVAIELVKESNVTWPSTAPASAEDGTSASTALQQQQASDGVPSLVALETMGAAAGTPGGSSSGSGRSGAGAAPAFLAVRSDGLLVTMTSAGAVVAGVSSGVDNVRQVVRSGSVIALRSDERIVLIELARRAPPRECAVPESMVNDGSQLTSVTFDAHVTQLLYAGTSKGEVLIFNGRARAPPPTTDDPAGVAQAAKRRDAGGIECRWLDSINTADILALLQRSWTRRRR